MTTPPSINDLFDLLDKWRHFPAFPLEARSEVLFALFLSTVLENCESVGVKVKPHIIPQFPLRQNRLDPRTHKWTNHSNNVDFFALAEDGTRAFLIELKTDMRSRREDQDKYLERAIETSMHAILCDYKKILESSTDVKYARQKYFHMSKALAELRLIILPENLEDAIYPNNAGRVSLPKVNELIRKICIPKSSLNPELIYIQPRKSEKDKSDNKHHYIYFKEFAKIVKNQGELGKQFASHLREWNEDPAEHRP